MQENQISPRYDYREPWKKLTADALNSLFNESGIAEKINHENITAEIPPDPQMGDIGFPMFSYSKILKKGPAQIAQLITDKIQKKINEDREKKEESAFTCNAKVSAQGPYVNIKLNRAYISKTVLNKALSDIENFSFARSGAMNGRKVMVEFSSPNTNKPLHLGHLRNDVLGESISRIMIACGAQVRKVCIINDRGIHICKSMLAYKEGGQGKLPESLGIKSDQYVGRWYVDFSQNLKKEVEELINSGMKKEEAEACAPSMKKAQKMLRDWEAGDLETVELWKQMNSWSIEGMKKTYERTGISFDQYYYESKTYMLGRDEVLKGLEKGIFFKQEDGAVAVDLSEDKLDKKILLRSDGTSIYITQDFGTAIERHKDWPFDQMIYVVGSEQQYHFKVLFILLDKLGYSWAKNLRHLSYGMVNLPEGKMKSREGTVVDADDLLDSLRDLALAEIREKGREEEVGEPSEVAEKIALGALHYFLLQVNPVKDMLFDPKESLSFNGNTGPYLQYMGARISSMLRKNEETEKNRGNEKGALNDIVSREDAHDFSLLTSDSEWDLIKLISSYPEAVTQAALDLDPSNLTGYLYELSKAFSRFYHECPILNCEDKNLSYERLDLCKAVMYILKDAFYLVCIPFLDVM